VLLLLVEDEAIIRFDIQDALESSGFEVVSAADGEAGLALIEQSDRRLSGLITDVNLGGEIDGWVLARRARELMAEICVVYITGDSASDWPAEGVPKSVLLQKPFADAQVRTAIAALLNEQSST
jgi:CheY-like chemotaxis protein